MTITKDELGLEKSEYTFIREDCYFEGREDITWLKNKEYRSCVTVSDSPIEISSAAYIFKFYNDIDEEDLSDAAFERIESLAGVEGIASLNVSTYELRKCEGSDIYYTKAKNIADGKSDYFFIFFENDSDSTILGMAEYSRDDDTGTYSASKKTDGVTVKILSGIKDVDLPS